MASKRKTPEGIAPGNWSACMTAVGEAAGGRLHPEDLHQILSDIVDKARERAGQSPIRDNDVRALGAELSAEAQAAAAIERANQIRNLNLRRKIEARIAAAPVGSYEAISGQLVRSDKGYAGAADAISIRQEGAKAARRAALEQELRDAGVFDRARNGHLDGDFERQVAGEMARLNTTGPLQPGEARGVPADVRAVAAIYARAGEALRQAKNSVGAYVGQISGYIVSQSHDAMKLLGDGTAAAFEKWRDSILPRLEERTFDGVEDRNAFLREAWLGLTTGVHQRLAKPGSEWLTGFTGPGNLAKKLSSERVLHFKSPEEWFDYNREWGRGSLWDAVTATLDKGARDVELMRALGTNPEVMFNAIRDRAIDRARKAGHHKEVTRLQRPDLDWKFDAVAGRSGIPGDATWANRAAGVRNFTSMTTYGMAMISSFGDLIGAAGTLHGNGMSWAEAMHSTLAAFVNSYSGEDARRMLSHLSVASTAMLESVATKVGAADGVAGSMAHALRTFYRWNGQEFWTGHLMNGLSASLSHNLAENAGRDFASLPRRLMVNLRRYGIGEAEWNAVRTADLEMVKGARHLTSDSARYLPDETVARYVDATRGGTGEAVTDRQIAAAREELQSRLTGYFVDQVKEGLSEATAKERVQMTRGLAPGTVSGEAIRFFMQAKSFTMTHTMRVYGRTFLRDGFDASNLAGTVIGMTALGYVAMVTKDLLKGKTPRVPDFSDYQKGFGSTTDILSSAMAQGGGLGILGDFMFGDYNRQGGGFLETMAGPSLGKVAQAARLFSEAKDDVKQNPSKLGGVFASHGLSLVSSLGPGLNMFYTKAAVDYLVLYQLQEALNPGFLRRMEDRTKKQNNQTFYLKPSEVVAARRSLGS
jgi:hypothetical protein